MLGDVIDSCFELYGFVVVESDFLVKVVLVKSIVWDYIFIFFNLLFDRFDEGWVFFSVV